MAASSSSSSATPSSASSNITGTVGNHSFMAIEVPAIVQNSENAISMLGGISSLQNARNGVQKFVEMRFRPADPLSHPIHGDVFDTNNLVLRLTRKKKKSGAAASSSEENNSFKGKIVGFIPKTARFVGMCDFQFLPPPIAADAGGKDIGEIVRSNDMLMGLGLNLLVENDEQNQAPLYFPPNIFSRRDEPYSYAFQQNPFSRVVSVAAEDGSGGQIVSKKFEITTQKPPKFYAVGVKWADPVPMHPPQDIKVETRDVIYGFMKDFFKERAVCSRRVIDVHSAHISHPQKMKRYLPMLSYYFTQGAWRQLWFQYGVDPRQDKSMRSFQLLDFRLTPEQKTALELKNRILNLDQPLRRSGYTRGGTSQDGNMRLAGLPGCHANTSMLESLRKIDPAKGIEPDYIFSKTSLPCKIQTYYQICDILIPEVQQLAQEASYPPSCLERTGWFLHEDYEKIRTIMKETLDAWISEKKFPSSAGPSKEKKKKASKSHSSRSSSSLPSSSSAASSSSSSSSFPISASPSSSEVTTLLEQLHGVNPHSAADISTMAAAAAAAAAAASYMSSHPPPPPPSSASLPYPLPSSSSSSSYVSSSSAFAVPSARSLPKAPSISGVFSEEEHEQMAQHMAAVDQIGRSMDSSRPDDYLDDYEEGALGGYGEDLFDENDEELEDNIDFGSSSKRPRTRYE